MTVCLAFLAWDPLHLDSWEVSVSFNPYCDLPVLASVAVQMDHKNKELSAWAPFIQSLSLSLPLTAFCR